MERVVVTGVGVVSCAGVGAAAFWDAMTHGRSGIDRIASFDPEPLTAQIAGEVRDFTFDAKLGKRMARFTQFAVAAADEALHQAGLAANGTEPPGKVPGRWGVAVGAGIGGETFLETQYEKFLERGPGKYHPLTIPIIIPNMASANIAIQHGLQGPSFCVSTACATGNHNIGLALDAIRAGRADVMVAGGCESTISAFAVDGYAQLRALSTRNDSPQTASRPFSAGRDGFVLAEGAGVLVLESETHAKARGAVILAELAGFGSSTDANHLTAPHPEGLGAVTAIRSAMDDAGWAADGVDYINAHGTSTPLNDALETAAIKQVLGEHAASTPISSIKSMVGHSLGGSAGIEAVACVLALQSQLIPPTINLDEPDPALDLDYVPHTAREAELNTVLSNSFAFGGHNAVLAFARYN